MKKFILFGLCIFAVSFWSCTDLEEQLNDGIPTVEAGEVDVQSLLDGAYGNLRDLITNDNYAVAFNHTTDEIAGPTRGRDWDDAGIWRVLHRHSWTPSHAFINREWRVLNRNAFNAQQVLCNGATGQTAAEATFLRAFNDFLTLDAFGKVPRRACGEDLLLAPTDLVTREAGAQLFINELEGAMSDLPDAGPADKATKNAARALLAKIYLNKAVYEATGADGAAQEGPYSFSAADMNKVIEYCDAIMDSGQTSLEDNYWDNFLPENGNESSEMIFVVSNSDAASGNIRTMWHMSMHYNQNPSGWNGFVALTDLYNKFEDDDIRKGAKLPYLKDNGSGMNVGFMVGQQHNANDEPLDDRNGNPLVFTPEFDLFQTGPSLEVTGIRCAKYAPDFEVPGGNSDNDWNFFRHADIMLMKAEAILRGGSSSDDPLAIVNTLRESRGASTLTSIDLPTLLDERGRELYWENWRRNDQIRFGTFLGTWQQKPNPSGPERLLFSIPGEAISTNPNLPQNPGY